MPLVLKPRAPLPPFTFDIASPSPPPPPYKPTATTTDDAVAGTNDAPPGGPASPPRPPMELLPEREMIMFGANPLRSDDDGKALVRCPRCSKVFMEWAAVEHKRICEHVLDGAPLDKKKVKADRAMKTAAETKKRSASEEMSPSSPSKKAKVPLLASSTVTSEDALAIATSGPHSILINLALAANPTATPEAPFKGLKKSEVRKLRKEAERIEKRRAKEREREEIAERKRLKISGPVDYDRQCGVINDKGLPCSRSLTCKTHTVGLKRAVEGRSRPYDELYLDWQRANNPNFKEPVPARVGGGGSGGANGGNGAERKDKRKEGKSAGNGGGGGANGHGSRANGTGAGDDDEDESFLRGEVDELIHWTRVSGERLKMALCPIFHRPRAVTGSSIRSLARPTLKGARTKSNSSSSGGAAGNSANSGATAGKVDNSLRPTSCTSLWAGYSDFMGVGELLTQALASRSKSQAQAATSRPMPTVNVAGTKITFQPVSVVGGSVPAPLSSGMGPNANGVPSQQQQQQGMSAPYSLTA